MNVKTITDPASCLLFLCLLLGRLVPGYAETTPQAEHAARAAVSHPLALAEAVGDSAANVIDRSLADEFEDVPVLTLKSRVRDDPTNGEARIDLATALLRSGDWQGAELEFRRAADLGMPAQSWQIGLADALLHLGRSNEAREVLDHISQSPEISRLRLLNIRAEIELSEGHLEQAAEILGEAANIDGDSERTRLGLIRLAQLSGDMERARERLQAFVDDHPNNTAGLLLWAKDARRRGDASDALKTYLHALAVDPQDLHALAGLAALRIELAQYEAADELLNTMDQLRSGMPMTAYLRGLSAFLQDDPKTALSYLEQTILVEPSHPQSRILAGLITLREGSPNTAATHFEVVLRQSPGLVEVRKLLGVSLIKAGALREAIRVLEGADEPMDPSLSAVLGSAYIAAGMADKGRALLSQAATDAPAQLAAIIRTHLARVDAQQGDLEGAIGWLESATAVDGAPLLSYVELMAMQAQDGNPSEALRIAATIEAQMPEDAIGYNASGVALMLMGDLDAAREKFEAALVKEPGFLSARLRLAELDLAQGQLDAAQRQLAAVLKVEPDSQDALLMLAKVAAVSGDEAAQLRWLNEAKAHAPTATEPRRRLVDYHLAKGDGERAVEEARGLVAKAPKDLNALGILFLIQQRTGNLDAARLTVDRLAANATDTDDTHRLVTAARMYLSLGEGIRAATAIERAVSADRTNVEARIVQGDIAIQTGDLERAKSAADWLLEDFPEQADSHRIAGEVALLELDTDAAVEHLEKAYRIDSNGRRTLDALVRAYQRAGLADKATDALATWLGQHPADVGVGSRLAQEYLSAGKNLDAIRVYEGLLEAGSEEAMLLNNLAWLLKDSDPERALKLAERAYGLTTPQNQAIADTYGWLLHQAGQNDEALAVLQDASATQPGEAPHPDVTLHLAIVLLDLGRSQEAKALLSELVLTQADSEAAEKARELLEQIN